MFISSFGLDIAGDDVVARRDVLRFLPSWRAFSPPRAGVRLALQYRGVGASHLRLGVDGNGRGG